MNQELQNKLTELAEKLDVTVDHLWGVMINQAHVYVFTEFVKTIALISALLFAIKLYRRQVSYHKDDWFDSEWSTDGALPRDHRRIFAGFMLVFFACFVFVASFYSFSGIITALFNPEYWDLSRLIGI